MLLRNSISNTRRFFKRTIETVKSFFSVGYYQKLPKSPLFTSGNAMNTQASYKDLDNFYTDFTRRWDSKEKANNQSNTVERKSTLPSSSSSPAPKQEKEGFNSGSFMRFGKASPTTKKNDHCRMRVVRGGKRQEDSSCSKGIREARSFLVAQKLRELEMMDMSNVDHVLDIEEVLHYYSRLTCPAYLDMVDQFFGDMYTEFFAPPASPRSVNSRPTLRSMRSLN